MICFLQLFFVKPSKYFFSVKITNSMITNVHGTVLLNLFNHKNFFRPIWNIACGKDVLSSSHQRCSVKKDLLEISQNSQENICGRVSFLIKLMAEVCNSLLKKRLWHRCFPVNFVKFLRTPFYIEYLWWLLLHTPKMGRNWPIFSQQVLK